MHSERVGLLVFDFMAETRNLQVSKDVLRVGLHAKHVDENKLGD